MITTTVSQEHSDGMTTMDHFTGLRESSLIGGLNLCSKFKIYFFTLANQKQPTLKPPFCSSQFFKKFNQNGALF